MADRGMLRHLVGGGILFLNWRCPWHPHAGGAERYVWEIATRLASAGAEVTLLTARAPGRPAREVRDGVEIVRGGGTFTVYPYAAQFLLRNAGRFAAVVDCQNGIPFFAPLCLLRRPVTVVTVVHHVHQDQFSLRFRWPLSSIGRMLESHVSRLVYGRHPVVVVSPSTRAEARRRLRLRGPITVVPNGSAIEPVAVPGPRSARPSLVSVGRLVAHKRLELLLTAAERLRHRWPALTVDIAGDGPERPGLEQTAARLGLGGLVTFHGRVSEKERHRLLARGWLAVIPSRAEGWGLTVIEANAAGRPAIGFRVPGVVDSVVEGWNGWLVDEASDLAAALDAALRTLADPAAGADVEARCRAWAARFSWDRTAERFARLLEAWVAGRRASAAEPAPPGSVTDSGTVVRLESSAPLDGLEDLALPCDVWAQDAHVAYLLFQGIDQSDAIDWLERSGLHGTAEVRAARTADLLFGPAEADR